VPALFALDGPTAWGYFPQSKQLARWRDGAWEYLNFTPDGEVLSIRSLGRVPEFAVRRDGGIQIVREDAVIDSLPNAAGAVMLLEDGVVFATADRVILRRADGTELNFDLQGAEAFFRMGEDYVQVRAAGTDYALRIERGHEQVFLLPQ
jgi:hypothetical protein